MIDNEKQGAPGFSTRLLSVFLRWFFHLLYHQLAWTYDGVAWIVSLGMWRTWVLSVFPYLERRRTLEIGFGPGHLQLALQRAGIPTFGLDESAPMGGATRKRLSEQGLSPQLVRGTAQYLPFASNCFYQVVLTFPAEFILEKTTFSEIHRILKGGGKAVVLPVAWITGQKPLERLAAWVNRITGQAPVWNPQVLEPVKKLGFEVSSEIISLPASQILILQFVKPVAE